MYTHTHTYIHMSECMCVNICVEFLYCAQIHAGVEVHGYQNAKNENQIYIKS